MKKGKLYTVTPWNKQALVKAEPLPAKNLFDGVNMPTQQMNNRRFGIGNYGGQQITFGTSNYGAAGNPFTPGTTAFNHYNIQSVENSISNGSYFNRNKDAFVYRPQNYVNGIDFTTNYNDTNQRWNSIVNSAAEGIGGWKPNVDTSGIPTQETSMAENPGWSTNPYLKAGMSIAGQIKTGDRRGVFDTLDPFHNWAGKKTSKAGQVLGDVGVALTSTGIPYAMLAGAALKIVGDFADLGWGYNIENEQEVKDNIAHLKNISIQDGDLDSIQQQYAQAGIADIDVGEVENGWFTDKGTEEAEKLTNQQDYYKTYAEHMFTNAANNYKQDQLFNALKQWSLPGSRPNQSAYGGPLDMKDNNIFDMGGGFNDDMPITNFGFISDYLTTKRKQAEQKNVLGNMFAGAPNSMFAVGGKFGGGSFYGSGAGGGWDEVSTDTYNVDNFNQAFDMAVADGLKEFIFQGRKYNTQKEKNPVREYNNRWVGQGRRANKKNPSKAYDHQAGPLGGPLADIPMVVDTYVGTPERPPQLEYDPNAMERGKALPYSWSNTVDRVKRIKPMKAFGGPLFAIGGDLQTNGSDWSTGTSSSYSLGKVYDVSEEEAKRLKSLGYEFTVVS